MRSYSTTLYNLHGKCKVLFETHRRLFAPGSNELPVSFLSTNLNNVVAVCVGSTAVTFGSAPTGLIEASVGVAGMIAFVLGKASKFGPECHRVRSAVQADVYKHYANLMSGSDGDEDARTSLEAANRALDSALSKCVIDRARLVKAALSPAGFASQATAAVMESLGEIRPELFMLSQRETVAYRFAAEVIAAGFAGALSNQNYYREIEPELMLGLAKSIGTIDEKVDLVIREQRS